MDNLTLCYKVSDTTWETYRRFVTSSLTVEIQRETLHINDDMGRMALVDTRTVGTGLDSAQLLRYQYSNQLSTATLELDETARIISYEEYHPYGTTSYQAMNASIKATAKRYRYTGKERDEESGLYYHGARYYIPWLCRWVSTEPLNSLWYNSQNIESREDLNNSLQATYPTLSPYNYCINNPIKYIDPDGKDIVDNDKIIADLKTTINNQISALEAGFKKGDFSALDITQQDLKEYIDVLKVVLDDIDLLEKSTETYSFYNESTFTSLEQGLVSYNSQSKDIDVTFNNVNFKDFYLVSHEIRHAVQYERGKVSLSTTTRDAGVLFDIEDEVESNNLQKSLAIGLLDFKNLVLYTEATLKQFTFPNGEKHYEYLQSGQIDLQSDKGTELKRKTLMEGFYGYSEPTEVYKGWEADFEQGQQLGLLH